MAQQAGVPTLTVYQALVQRPITQSDAEKVLSALSEHTQLQLTLEKVEIVIWEQFDMLWIIRASTGAQLDAYGEVESQYLYLYARDQAHAQACAAAALAQWLHLPHHSYSPCSAGLRIGDVLIPGRAQIDGDE